jgi:amidohydrolase
MRRIPTLVLALAVLAPASLRAQTTDTEMSAAVDVLRRIGELEGRLKPTDMATRLANRKDAGRDRVVARTAELWGGGMQELADWIGHNPEVGWDEHQAVDTLVKVLRGVGFTVETGVADLETAFVATWTSPAGANGPTLGLIGEYDALRGTKGAYHGDQHNAQTPVAISAARALAEYMTAENVPGTIKLYGTPAEEVGPPAKTIMFKAGIFDGADILVRSHSSTGTGRGKAGFGICCLNINEVKYVFSGYPSHQLSSWFGRNALEAAVQFYTSVDRLRSTLRPEARIQGVIPEGGVAPNVVPDRAVVDYYIRYPDEVYLEHMQEMIDNAAKGAAMATGTKVEIEHYGEYRDGISLGSLEELTFAYAKKLGAPELEPEPGRPAGYEETGWVSREIPGVGVSVASSTGANHTYQMLDDAFTDLGHTGFRMDAQIMAAVLYDFLTQPKLRDAVGTEQTTLAGLLEEYHAQLRKAYAQEMQGPPVGADKPGH